MVKIIEGVLIEQARFFRIRGWGKCQQMSEKKRTALRMGCKGIQSYSELSRASQVPSRVCFGVGDFTTLQIDSKYIDSFLKDIRGNLILGNASIRVK